ncbi:hypothetical protein [Phocaeicola vulgatus]|jgi:hypothetical protein|uniref:hypothetical protein n=1 Tax=Phocaeicola vulgatus TaxID=821 RepID=UPI00125CB235|nr:hypothetical protein [Phocaeicola vulgatus]DAL96396.1 MAG TPA: hypothetical protein [Caudoviricetes sp.]KAB5483191.1 hypothetical protein F9002_12540 [Phocaeicola vulgatus]MDB1030817.1 hypothetical protein [Phocaeicola vulgatus]MDB1037917.1 hypothetical protein [Phocaeicola vulgatus]MDB1059820.1 hypothetical protein [Phocaeicola vulgatus]
MAKKKETKGFEFIIKESDVLERENFGSFEIVVFKQGICFKNYTGYKVFTTPYAVGLDGVAHETSLYAWLRYMVDFKKSIKGKENEMFGETTSTNKEFLDGMKVLTEANLIKPMTVFTDINDAQKEAENYMKWMEGQMKDLNKAMNTTPPEEDLKANAEFEQKAIIAEEAEEMFDDGTKTEEGQV